MGLLVTASSVAQAFDDLYYFERAAETLMLAYASGPGVARDDGRGRGEDRLPVGGLPELRRKRISPP